MCSGAGPCGRRHGAPRQMRFGFKARRRAPQCRGAPAAAPRGGVRALSFLLRPGAGGRPPLGQGAAAARGACVCGCRHKAGVATGVAQGGRAALCMSRPHACGSSLMGLGCGRAQRVKRRAWGAARSCGGGAVRPRARRRSQGGQPAGARRAARNAAAREARGRARGSRPAGAARPRRAPPPGSKLRGGPRAAPRRDSAGARRARRGGHGSFYGSALACRAGHKPPGKRGQGGQSKQGGPKKERVRGAAGVAAAPRGPAARHLAGLRARAGAGAARRGARGAGRCGAVLRLRGARPARQCTGVGRRRSEKRPWGAAGAGARASRARPAGRPTARRRRSWRPRPRAARPLMRGRRARRGAGNVLCTRVGARMPGVRALGGTLVGRRPGARARSGARQMLAVVQTAPTALACLGARGRAAGSKGRPQRPGDRGGHRTRALSAEKQRGRGARAATNRPNRFKPFARAPFGEPFGTRGAGATSPTQPKPLRAASSCAFTQGRADGRGLARR